MAAGGSTAKAAGFLSRLARDTRGNVLAIMAAALIPLIGMVGGGIDISRMYMTKTRLQHACDAGVLAGRKQMGGGVWGTDDNAVAQKFFDANFATGAYGSTGLTRSFSENAGDVSGTASATLPMTLTRVIGRTSEVLSVTCEAAMKLPNTDVMFVLDTTGSMNCATTDPSCTNNGGVPEANSKIDGLKTAVKCFYEILAQLDTDATCTTGTPSGGTSSAVQIRFGFMPYSSNVNVGKLLPSSYFANSWPFQSRVRDAANPNAWTDWTTYKTRNMGSDSSTCVAQNTNTTTQQYQSIQTSRSSHGGGTTYTCNDQSRSWAPNWDYQQVNINYSAMKSGNGWGSYSFNLPINDDGSNRTINWDGCIEERATVRQTSYDPIPSGAYDLNIDLVPTASDPKSLWGPALDDVLYYRAVETSWSQATTNNSTTTDDYYNTISYACPTQATKLQSWPDPVAFDNYVNSLTASGNTYHDIGMLWGARFMSPTGIFKSENATAANGGQIQRHMIFMTDGDSTSAPCDFNAYGIPFWDQLQTTSVGTASNCTTNNQALIDQINARLTTLCKAVQQKGITLWVVSYGTGGTTSATEQRLSNCASPPDSVASTHYFKASDPAALQSSFNTIANAISQLRLTQ